MRSEYQKLCDNLWELCHKLIYHKYNVDSYVKDSKGRPAISLCYTCGKECEGKGRHLGHFIPSSAGGILLKYNLDNLRPQCYHCNINLGGNGSEYAVRLRQELGNRKFNNLYHKKYNKTDRCGIDVVRELVNKYAKKVNKIYEK